MGGPSAEHDVSCESGRQVYEALAGHERIRVMIGQDGRWQIEQEAVGSLGATLDRLADEVDVAFVALHGTFGEDGTIQGLLESFGISYTGSKVAASSLAMDKLRTKLVYRAAGLPIPDFAAIYGTMDPSVVTAELEKAAERLGFPMVLKPNESGSSCGISFPADFASLVEAVESYRQQGRTVLLERMVEGRELTCGVIDVRGEAEALPITEIIPGKDHAFFDYVAKYTPGATEEITPARISDVLRDEVQRHAVEAHRVLGCRDMSRTDFMVNEAGKPVLLETNTIPGFTKTSLLPQAAAAVGIDFAQLVELLARAADRRRTGFRP